MYIVNVANLCFLEMSLVTKKLARCYSSASAFKLPTFEGNISQYKGPSYHELLKIRKNRLNPALTTFYSKPLALHQGYKQWLFDINGKRYLDMFGGICTVSVGHCHPKVSQAVAKQMNTLGHVSNIYVHPKIHEYALRLTDKLPGDLKVVYFVNSGSEANDLAALMARAFTNNSEIVTLRNGYHGMSFQTMGLTAMSHFKYPVTPPAAVHNVTNPDVYKGLWGGSHCRDSPVQANRQCSCSPDTCEAKDKYVEDFEDMFKYNIYPGRLAAFFAEPIQGVGGTVQFPKGYLKEAYKIVKQNGGVYVSDEIQTAFGRMGDHYWGFEMHGFIPDIVTLAKGIGNGFPLGAVITRPDIAEGLTKASHFNTFGGNPVACAAGIAVLDVIEEEKLQENSKEVGTYLLLQLEKLRSEFPIVGDVRGKGLMIGVELVKGDGTTKHISEKLFMELLEFCRDASLIIGNGGYHGNVIRIKPPMCITKEDADYTVDVLRAALKKISV